jgi:hypothetical protein
MFLIKLRIFKKKNRSQQLQNSIYLVNILFMMILGLFAGAGN